MAWRDERSTNNNKRRGARPFGSEHKSGQGCRACRSGGSSGGCTAQASGRRQRQTTEGLLRVCAVGVLRWDRAAQDSILKNNEAAILDCIPRRRPRRRNRTESDDNTGQVAVTLGRRTLETTGTSHGRRQSRHNHHQHQDEALGSAATASRGHLLDVHQSRTPHARLER